MELYIDDNFDNIITLIKEDSNNLLEVLDFIEDNYNEILLQRLSKKLKEINLNVSEQLNKYFHETLVIEENLSYFQSDLSKVLDSITAELEKGNYDLHDWTSKYRDKLLNILTKFNKRCHKEDFIEKMKKLYFLLLFNGLNANKFKKFIEFIDSSNKYCVLRRKISGILDSETREAFEGISDKTIILNNKINFIFSKLEDAYSDVQNQGVLKMGFYSNDLDYLSKVKVVHEMDKLFSSIFKSLSSVDSDIVKHGISNMENETKKQLSKNIVGMNKGVLAESKSLEGVFYRAVRYANQL